ncbi:hypothetical protein GCM10011514_49500 [Emticicia aquatilis]|uniref:YDG domain-containing protein n=1 Tax=Emticicia aquatilis TaxID=1537369 RepID=A0A916Z820_9BACT|nr:YDG domain-containing protein [Emticicia aquatilis]GGD79624.1 hypothetical protein GCM10011514_49500 [Emticicia aquatilis]
MKRNLHLVYPKFLKLSLFFLFLFVNFKNFGQISYSTRGSNYTQNFDNLYTTVPANNTTQAASVLPNGWIFTEAGTNANTTLRNDNGSSGTGDTYLDGATTSNERAFGSYASGSLTSQFGAFFTNNTGSTLTQFTLSYVGEQWKDGGSASAVINKLTFAYAISPSSLTVGTYNNVSQLDFTALTNNTTSDITLDGNLAINQSNITYTVTGISWPAGATLYIRWTDINETGNDDNLAIDGVVFSATALPTISTSGTLSAVNTTYGSPSSTPTSFTVSGSNLTNDILITPPSTNFEVSQSNASSGYADTQTLTQSGGTINSTTIYVRLKATATVSGSPYSGNIVLSSTNATSVNVATVSSSVSPKNLTITGITANNKVYDGNNSATISGTPTYVGLENGESFAVTGSPIATFSNTTVGNSKTVTVTGYTAPSSNYTLSQPSLTATITAAPLTISNPVAQNKVYDRTTNAVITGTLNGIIGSEIVTLNGTGSFASSAVGNGIAVTSNSTLGGADAGNYTLTQPTGLTANITAKPLTITGISANNKVYDGTSTATLSGTAILNGVVLGDESDVTLSGSPMANFAQATVGTGIAVSVTGYNIIGSAANNYSLSQPTGLLADITNLPTPIITSTLTTSATYGAVSSTYIITATNSPTSFNATGLPPGLSINTTTGEITGTPTSIVGSPFSVTISATNNGGTGSATLMYTINKKTLTLNTTQAQNKIYDRTNAATITGTLNGVVGSDEVTLIGTGIFAQSSVGDGIAVTSSSTLSGADANKYILTQPTGLTANITKKELTVSVATASNKVYDGNNSAIINGATLVGVINPDEVTVGGNGIFTSIDAGDNISVSTSLTLGGVDASNYMITQPTGITANITKASLTISGITVNNKIYDGNTTATLSGIPTLDGIINNDDVSITGTVSATFGNKNIGTAKPVTVNGYTLSGTKAGNYILSQPTGLTANISALALTLSGATAQNKVFDGNTNATITGTLTGVISPDVVTFTGAGTFASSAVGNGIAVTANITLGGAGASNYTITQPTGLTANITPAPSITEVIFPQYAINGTTAASRLQYVCRLRLDNLLPNATYRYTNGAPTAGNMMVINNNTGTAGFITGYTSQKSLGGSLMSGNEFNTTSNANRYGELTTDASGTYEGWFVIVPTSNSAFNAGLSVPLSIQLNNGANGTSVVTTLTTSQTFTMLTPTSGTNGANAIRGSSGASGEEIIFLYDNSSGTGRPLYGTFTENDGITTNFSTWYNSVDGTDGSWGAYIPVNLSTGVRRIEKRDVATGIISGCPAIDDDGIWASGANTVNPAGGTTPIIITNADAPLNTCQVFNIAPTIVIDVATTSNYIDGGSNTNISGSYPLSAVIDDPTDPAKTLGINFTIGDTETAVGSLTVSVTSNNTSVVPNANLVLTGTGASRNLKITPISAGYATITVTVNDGTTNTTFTLNYAASQASNITTNTHFHTGKSDASTAIKVDNELMLVADDEDQTIRLYNRNNSGLPINSFDFTSVLGLTDISGGIPREVDIEASLKIGSSIYWMGSESNASSGNNRPNRNRVFRTDITGTGVSTSLTYVSRYDFLKDDILAWDANNVHGKGANYYGLVASAAAGVIPESTGLKGFNIEGIEMAPDNTTAYIAFRAPQVVPADRKKALIIPVTNFTSILAANGGTIGSATFGTPIELNLGERGIREIRKNDTNEYLIIAGPADAATGTAPKDFKFYTWTGKPADDPIKRSFNLSSIVVEGSFESIVEVPTNLNTSTNIQLLVDNGDAIYYGDGTIAKELPQNNWKKFRSETVSLSAPVIEIGTIAQNLCTESAVSLPFVFNNETFNIGNIFTAQLSDANGSFANPVSIGTLTGINSGTINVTIPSNTVAGNGYRIRIISSNPMIVGADNGTNISVNAKPSKPTITASSTTICSGSSTTLTASACTGGTLNWTGGLTGSSITVSPTSNSSYTVTCTIAGCTSDVSDATAITVNAKPSKPTITTSSTTICSGSSTTLTASACTGGTLNWTGGLTGSSITVSPTSNSSYTVTCTIAGCTSDVSDATAITVNAKPSKPTITASSTTICSGSSTTLTASACTGGTLNWTGGLTGSSITVSPTSNSSYTVTCTIAGCTSEVSDATAITVNAKPSKPTITASSTTICSGNSTTLTASACTGGMLNWTGGLTGSSITVSPTSNSSYTVTCTIAGCVSDVSDATTITVSAKPNKPTITASSTTICSGNSTTLTASACTGGTLNWTGGLTGSSITVSPISNSSYTVTCTIAGCVSDVSDATAITVNTKPSKPTTTASLTTICSGSSTTLTASACTGGTLNWTGGLTGSSITVSPTSSSSYTVTCTIAGCVSDVSDATAITVNAKPSAPTIVANPTIITIGQSSTLTANGCSSGVITWSYNNSNANPLTVTPSSTTNYMATCTINGCVSIVSTATTITVNSAGPCLSQVSLVSTADDYSTGSQLKQANANNGSIQASNKITGNAIVTYQAKSIQLSPGFKADAGTVFKAEIGGCN